jgi:cobyrinic acid a,c-diamide synthase
LAKIGVARDAVFCFYYPENLNRLKKSGAELVYFSPLSDSTLPEGIGGLHIGGGYPESFAGALAENASLRREIRKCGESGMPIHAAQNRAEYRVCVPSLSERTGLKISRGT